MGLMNYAGIMTFWYCLFNAHYRARSESAWAEMRKDNEGRDQSGDQEAVECNLTCPCRQDDELLTTREVTPLAGGGKHVLARAVCPVCGKEIVKEFRFMRGTMWFRWPDGSWMTFVYYPPYWKFWRYLWR
jgi:hypothetical protein